MNQEKQKVIRVLKPTKKTKKVSPLYYGIAGATLGIAMTSVLLFSFLGKESNLSASPVSNGVSTGQVIESEKKDDPQERLRDTAQIEQDGHASDTQENEDNNAHDGFDIPQPKANEINGIFTHKKVEQAQIAPQPATNDNPFGALSGDTKPVKPAISTTKPETHSKISSTNQKPTTATALKAQASKSSDTSATKITHNTKQADVAKPEAVTAKQVPKEKESEVETPNATVQISVTTSVKE